MVNVTPDSFSDGGLYMDAEAAVRHGEGLAAQGAEILDVGGESTRPGAEAVGEDEERRRVEPVVAALAGAGHQVSIDTSKLAVAEAALDAGASIVNDVTAMRAAPEIGALCADRGAGLILMHMRGDPRTMQDDPSYGDVVDDVKAFLAERLEAAVAAGAAEERDLAGPGNRLRQDPRAQPRAAAPARRAARSRPAARGRHLAQELHRQDRRLRGWPAARRHDRLRRPRRRRGSRRPARPRRRPDARRDRGGGGDPRVASEAASTWTNRGHENGIEERVEVDLRGLSIYTHHGVSEAEQEIGQRLEFDVSFDVPDCDAVLTDRLEDTVDYGEVCDIVALAATERSYRTLERLAQVVGERLMERYGCESVRVRAAKPEPPLPLAIQEVGVEVVPGAQRGGRRGDGEEA